MFYEQSNLSETHYDETVVPLVNIFIHCCRGSIELFSLLIVSYTLRKLPHILRETISL